jgi:hypothetical protein
MPVTAHQHEDRDLRIEQTLRALDGTRKITETIADLDDGAFDLQAGAALRRVVAASRRSGYRGRLTIHITVAAEGKIADIVATMQERAPAHAGRAEYELGDDDEFVGQQLQLAGA